jgi:hypothetical protein
LAAVLSGLGSVGYRYTHSLPFLLSSDTRPQSWPVSASEGLLQGGNAISRKSLTHTGPGGREGVSPAFLDVAAEGSSLRILVSGCLELTLAPQDSIQSFEWNNLRSFVSDREIAAKVRQAVHGSRVW